MSLVDSAPNTRSFGETLQKENKLLLLFQDTTAWFGNKYNYIRIIQ